MPLDVTVVIRRFVIILAQGRRVVFWLAHFITITAKQCSFRPDDLDICVTLVVPRVDTDWSVLEA